MPCSFEHILVWNRSNYVVVCAPPRYDSFLGADLALVWLRKACETVGDASIPTGVGLPGTGAPVAAFPRLALGSIDDVSGGASRAFSGKS